MNDVRLFLRVLVMFLPLPIFWALFDQQVHIYIITMQDLVITNIPVPSAWTYIDLACVLRGSLALSTYSGYYLPLA